jgi:hypothetical protein
MGMRKKSPPRHQVHQEAPSKEFSFLLVNLGVFSASPLAIRETKGYLALLVVNSGFPK